MYRAVYRLRGVSRRCFVVGTVSSPGTAPNAAKNCIGRTATKKSASMCEHHTALRGKLAKKGEDPGMAF